MAEAYSLGVAKIVVAQLAEVAGFTGGVQASALETLADLLLRYIAEAGHRASDSAELASRSTVNVADLLLVLREMGASPRALKDYADYVRQDEVPFAQPVTDYPVAGKPRPVPSFADKKETPPDHIPSFLPAFPDNHTYQSEPTYPSHDKDPKRVREKLNKQRQSAAKAVVNQHARTSEAGKGEEAQAPLSASQGVGPFFAAPLWEDAGAATIRDSSKDALTAQPMELEPPEASKPSPDATIPITNTGSTWAASGPGTDRPVPDMHVTLDWSKTLQRQALISSSNMPFEDIAAEDDEKAEGLVATTDKARKRKSTTKGAAAKAEREREPAVARAEQLLAAAEAGLSGEQAVPAPEGAEVL